MISEIQTSSQKWLTGTPLHCIGQQAYFDRESGLISCGLNHIGVFSRSLCLGNKSNSDHEHLIRSTIHDLEDSDWWKSQNITGLIFYTWANPNYMNIIQAAKRAGIFTAQFTDAEGIESPIVSLRSHIASDYSHYWYEPKIKQVIRSITKLPFTLSLRIFQRDIRMAKMIMTGDCFFTATPQACERYKLLVKRLLGHKNINNIHHVPQPVNFHFSYDGTTSKENLVIAVGRWDSTQKRSPLLMQTISKVLAINNSIKFEIFGSGVKELEQWHQNLTPKQRDRVSINGVVSNSELRDAYKRAKIMLVSSAYEGCHNASAEAVCSGVTIVGCESPYLEVLKWHSSKNSGTLSNSPSPDNLSNALMQEFELWENNKRNPIEISKYWVQVFHPDKVAKKIINIYAHYLSNS